jgi:hypothetical protein
MSDGWGEKANSDFVKNRKVSKARSLNVSMGVAAVVAACRTAAWAVVVEGGREPTVEAAAALPLEWPSARGEAASVADNGIVLLWRDVAAIAGVQVSSRVVVAGAVAGEAVVLLLVAGHASVE